MKSITLLPILTLSTTLFLYSLLPNTDTPIQTQTPTQLQQLIPGTYLNEYDPNTTDRQGQLVLCSVDNVNPPITGGLMQFTSFTARIIIERPTLPDYVGIPDTYADPGNCVVL